MIPESFLIDIFLYFARFPKREGIYPMFNLGASTIPGYAELREKVDLLSEYSITDIENYIFGANFEGVLSRVNNIEAGKDYLFVDFGEVDCDTDRFNRRTDSARLAITVAFRMKSFSSDLIEQTLAFGHALTKIIDIRNRMISDQQNHPWLKDISNNHTFVPFISSEMNSLGWSMLFNREGYDSFGVKNR